MYAIVDCVEIVGDAVEIVGSASEPLRKVSGLKQTGFSIDVEGRVLRQQALHAFRDIREQVRAGLACDARQTAACRAADLGRSAPSRRDVINVEQARFR